MDHKGILAKKPLMKIMVDGNTRVSLREKLHIIL